MGRIMLFVATNIAVILTFSVVSSILGLNRYVTASGLDYQALLVFCLVWGMVASFVSLQMSRWAAKTFLRVKVIPADSPGEYGWLVNMVHAQAKQAGLPKMPEVGVYQSDDANAFATGPSKSRSLVAFSSGILRLMNKNELEGVSAHEISHIQNGDMVTMTLIQGVVNAFVMFFARIIAYFASRSVKEEFSGLVNFICIIVFQIVFGVLGELITSWFSRQREFRADAGSATLVGKESMKAALRALANAQQSKHGLPEGVAALGIRNKPMTGLMALRATHPPIEERIRRLG